MDVIEKTPEQIRIRRFGPKCFMITVLWSRLDTTDHSTHNWKAFLERRGWSKVPRVWDF